MTRTLMIMAGGTGGHVMPGLAVAQVMRARAWDVVWLGNPQGMEADLVPRHGIRLLPVHFSGLRGKGPLAVALLPLRLLRAFWQSVSALRASRPEVVLGMGGYVAFPGGMMAVLLNRPLVIHEQNSVAGLTNRVLAHIADRVLEAFPGSIPKAQHCGNPLRESMFADDDPAARIGTRTGPLRVLVVGGSLGARALNEVVPAALAAIEPGARAQVLHQSGRGQADGLRDAYAKVGVQAEVREFIDDIAQAYRDADLVICRAGAITVSELAAVGAPSVLVPFPHAVDDHQTTNARWLADAGAAVLMPQSALTPAALAQKLTSLDRATLVRMAVAARSLARPDAASRVADACEAVARPPRSAS